MRALELGVFARVFPPGPAAEVAASVAAAGYTVVQLNLGAIGLPKLPSDEQWAAIDSAGIGAAFTAAGLSCWGLSCSYNMAHPDAAVRRAGTLAALRLIAHAPAFGARAVTLCAGSRDPERMWAHHPDNHSAAAWRDMRAELDLLLASAEKAGIVLALEPEPGVVVRDAEAAVRLYAELGDDAALVGIIADPANLLTGRRAETHHEVLEHAFSALAQRIACVHAKDLVPWADTLAGNGVVDYGHVASLVERHALEVPLIVQDVAPEQASAARAYLGQAFGIAA